MAGVKGANGGELLFTYNKEGYLIRVKDHTGREVRLWYRYGKLWKFVNSLGHVYIYEYNENGKFKSVQTPMGITGVQNEYDAEGRVLKQTMSEGSVVELRYDDANMEGRRIISGILQSLTTTCWKAMGNGISRTFASTGMWRLWKRRGRGA